MKHLLVVNTLTYSLMTPEFILLPLVSHFQHLWRSSVTLYVIAYKSLLFCKLCYPCHFCVVLLFKGSCHLSQFLYIPLNLPMSPSYPASVRMIFVLKSYQFILVRRSCWMMLDASVPSFRQSRPINYNSLSGTETRDLYSTLEIAVLSGKLLPRY